MARAIWGSLKPLSPELIGEVSIINAPSARIRRLTAGLGVVQIRQRESLPDEITARFQGGQFPTPWPRLFARLPVPTCKT